LRRGRAASQASQQSDEEWAVEWRSVVHGLLGIRDRQTPFAGAAASGPLPAMEHTMALYEMHFNELLRRPSPLMTAYLRSAVHQFQVVSGSPS
jgi:hypothetical protein